MVEKLIARIEQVALEHIPYTTNIYADALAILGTKLTFVEEQPNIALINVFQTNTFFFFLSISGQL